MSSNKSDEKIQINLISTKQVKKELQRIARTRSIEQDKDISYLDIIRDAIEEVIQVSGSIK